MVIAPDIFKQPRRHALEESQALAWPSRNDEEWRRTDPSWLPALCGEPSRATSPGFIVETEKETQDLMGSRVIIASFQTAFQKFPQLLEQYLGRVGNPEGLRKLALLHQALWEDGLFCFVPKGVNVPVPLKAKITATSREGAIFPHVLIVLEEGARLTLIDERQSAHSEDGAKPILSNEMVEIVLSSGAQLTYIHLQQWANHVNELFHQRAVLEADAQLTHLLVEFGGGVVKGNVETILQGTGCRSDLLAVLLGSGTQHYDFHTLQDHQAKTTVSDLLYKSALKDHAQLIYTGLIRIRKQAQKSNAYQANRNLLLSDGAKADSIPMLEIEADDVRCTHGVAVGPIEEEQLFYLMSRGLPPEEAEHLIVEGFFDQIFQRIPAADVREELSQQVARRL